MSIQQDRAISPQSYIALFVGVVIFIFSCAKQEEKPEAAPVEIVETAGSLEIPVNSELFLMAKPLETLQVTAAFGLMTIGNVHPSGHFGTDFACEEGEPIYAGFNGLVELARLDPATLENSEHGYGNHVRLSQVAEDSRWVADYGHMSALAVSKGQQVQTGEVLGYCGSTGHAIGTHLHISLMYGEERVNPMDYIVQ